MMKAKLLFLVSFLLLSLPFITAQEWSPAGATPADPISRSGPVTIGNIINPPLNNPNIPLEVRGTNVLLQLPNDDTDFVALGRSGGPVEVACDLWGFRAQRFADRSVSLGVTPEGDNRAILNYGANINSLDFTIGTDQRCGAVLASLTPSFAVFNVPVFDPFGFFQPASDNQGEGVQIQDPLEKMLG
ncbi:MAG: hypothetical protein AAFU67_17345, partial [Bacteroidota bacterium]